MATASDLDLTERNIVNEVKAVLLDHRLFLLELKVPLVKINEIFHKKESTPTWALTEGISYWLHTTEKPTWEDVAVALEKCSCYRDAWKVRQREGKHHYIKCIKN